MESPTAISYVKDVSTGPGGTWAVPRGQAADGLDRYRLLGEHTAYAACGVAIVDLGPVGKVLAANELAYGLLDLRGASKRPEGARLIGLDGGGESLRFIDRSADQALQDFLRHKGRSSTDERSWFRVPRTTAPALAALIAALPRPIHADRSDRTAYRLHVLDPYHERTDGATRWCTMWKLTRAECRVATKLLQGMTAGEIARETGVSANAVRFHIKSLLAKTGTKRQAQLLLVLSRTSYFNPL